MGRMVYLHCYVAKDSTPTVADEINGPTVGVDEEELRKNPDAVKQRMVDDFIGWLKGKPALEDYTKVVGGEGTGYAGFPKDILAQADERRKQKRHGVVEKTRGFIVMVTKRNQVVVRDEKTGRFSSRSKFLES